MIGEPRESGPQHVWRPVPALERRTPAPEARLPRTPADAGPVRVRGGDQVAREDGGHDVRREAGEHELQVRVVDTAGKPQDEALANAFPNGSSGLHTLKVSVQG